nr:Canalicular multispecific organic anion transporter 2 [Polyrhizophydium stewartii]
MTAQRIASVLLKLVHLALTLALPLAIPQVVQLLAPTPNGPSLLVSNGYAAAAMLLAMQLGLALADVSGKSVALAIEVRLRAILANAIFAKTLVLSPAARQSFSAGRVSNLMSSDITSILNLVKSMNDIWAVPVRVALSAYLIYVFLGNAMWVAVGAIVVLSIVQSAIGPRLGASVGKYVSAMDSRINTLREFLLGVRVVKLQALEESFVAKTTPIRETQMAALRSFISVLIALFTAIDVQIALVPPMTLAAHAAFGNTLQPGNVFAALSIFDGLLMPLQFLPQIISIMSETLVSYKRITEFLLADEIKPDEITQLLSASKSPDGTALKISAASFTWEEVKKDDDKPKPKSKRRIFKKKKSKDNVVANADADKKDGDAESDKPAPFALQDITLDIPRGSLVAVVGSVGSGKSSLLSALIGGMRKTAGDSALFGSVAYCAQEPWILTGTIEENIVFGNDAVRDRIPAAIAAACLDRDLEILPNGLGTQIGEKGINLSGGQKARVALARAIARDADIYLLDDPIAALDAHVGKKVFDDAICGVLRGKTVILVTHQLHLLPKVDTVVVLDEGRVVETGSFRELMAREDGALAEIMKDYHFDDAEAEAGKDAGDDADADGDKPEDIVKAVKAFEEEKAVEEDRRVGRVSLATYKAYFRAAGRWLLPTLAAVWLALLLGRLTPRVMLSIWTSGLNQFGLSTHQFMPLYVGLGAIEVLTDGKLSSRRLPLALWLC